MSEELKEAIDALKAADEKLQMCGATLEWDIRIKPFIALSLDGLGNSRRPEKCQ